MVWCRMGTCWMHLRKTNYYYNSDDAFGKMYEKCDKKLDEWNDRIFDTVAFWRFIAV